MSKLKIGRIVDIKLTGSVFAVFDDNSPVLLNLPQLGRSFTLFRTPDDLRFYLGTIGVTGYRIKQVYDGNEFMRSKIPYPVVCDMKYDSETNKSKWKLIMPYNQA